MITIVQDHTWSEMNDTVTSPIWTNFVSDSIESEWTYYFCFSSVFVNYSLFWVTDSSISSSKSSSVHEQNLFSHACFQSLLELIRQVLLTWSQYDENTLLECQTISTNLPSSILYGWRLDGRKTYDSMDFSDQIELLWSFQGSKNNVELDPEYI